MNTQAVTNTIVKTALEAWQNADLKTWLSLFTRDASLYDDENRRDFMVFSKEAIGHERFTSIDKVEENGMAIYGQFHSDEWGDFKTYFRFHINSDNKIQRLDIGQAHY